MRTKRAFPQVVKRIFHPELECCLECSCRLERFCTISQRTVITLSQVVQITHCGYRCPQANCSGRGRLYRSAQADTLALPGFTFGLDVVLLVGQLRLGQHQTIDEVHQILLQRLAPLQQSISRREILFLFETYTALLRSGTEVTHDQEWRDVARLNGGLLLSIDGIQPDKGNETIYLVRDLLTGRLLTAEKVTSSTKEAIKRVLAPVVALELPILGVISDAQESQLQAVAELWPATPHQICQFHALREAGRLIYVLDHRIKTDMRIRMQQKTHAYRQDLARRSQQVQGQEARQVAILDEYAATVLGTLNLDSTAPFEYAGLAMEEGLQQIHSSLEQLEKRGLL
jgi:hypothetical protein